VYKLIRETGSEAHGTFVKKIALFLEITEIRQKNNGNIDL
jgi:hypothetical protein